MGKTFKDNKDKARTESFDRSKRAFAPPVSRFSTKNDMKENKMNKGLGRQQNKW
jgi:hypothetical protein